jgi:hypothetical protein
MSSFLPTLSSIDSLFLMAFLGIVPIIIFHILIFPPFPEFFFMCLIQLCYFSVTEW